MILVATADASSATGGDAFSGLKTANAMDLTDAHKYTGRFLRVHTKKEDSIDDNKSDKSNNVIGDDDDDDGERMFSFNAAS
ncbi:unnamed protein product [Phytophthora lilii]|uniref:RxLR effector protein n=1 Tax=Phytophthora lilii TaxID=2077276 RepID=A0A9W6X5I6_9STRA|nr:unnamed protein product [Phytophthora lilii]